MTGTPLPLNLLVAFPYMSDDVLAWLAEVRDDIRITVDSGAFTAFNTGKEITLSQYTRFLERMIPKVEPDHYFTLDVYGDAEGTQKNYLELITQGFTPSPVWTCGESTEQLHEYLNDGRVVGIGGTKLAESRAGYFKHVMNESAGHPVHLLGMTNIAILKRLRPFMCDSSTWEAGARYGQGRLPLADGNLYTIKHQDPGKYPAHVLNYLNRMGFSRKRLADPQQWRGGKGIARVVLAAGWMHHAQRIEENLGTQMYMACATLYALQMVHAAYRREVLHDNSPEFRLDDYKQSRTA